MSKIVEKLNKKVESILKDLIGGKTITKKETEGLSDQKIFENCRFKLLVRNALGLLNADDPLPTESTYYLFRKGIQEYAKENNENLLETGFSQITKGQCAEFGVSGKRIRMDSKLLGSNIIQGRNHTPNVGHISVVCG